MKKRKRKIILIHVNTLHSLHAYDRQNLNVIRMNIIKQHSIDQRFPKMF